MIQITPETYPNQTLEVTLSGVDCTLRLDWQERTSRWRASLYLADGTPLVEGVKLLPWQNVLALCSVEGAPVGQLIPTPRSAKVTTPPDLYDWGARYDLTWLDAADVEALGLG